MHCTPRPSLPAPHGNTIVSLVYILPDPSLAYIPMDVLVLRQSTQHCLGLLLFQARLLSRTGAPLFISFSSLFFHCPMHPSDPSLLECL